MTKISNYPCGLDLQPPAQEGCSGSTLPPEMLLPITTKDNTAPHNHSPLNLAYIGDAVYSLLVRTRLVTQANRPTHALNKAATAKVKATDQSTNYYKLQPHLKEEELSVLKRGRNASPATKAKSASLADYRNATGLEALFGYLYLNGQNARILELFDICWSDSNEERP